MATLDPNIYKMSEVLNEVSKNFFPEQDEDTMSLGLYGFLNSINAMHMSNDIRIAQENANEMFYNRARLIKNIRAYAIQNNISGINATPASIPVLLWISREELDTLIENHNHDYAVLDTALPIMIGEYEYHLEYDLHIYKKKLINKTSIYSAQYNMKYPNNFCNIDFAFIDTPYIFKRNNIEYVCFSLELRQMFITKFTKELASSNSIENKSFKFNYTNQLIDFNVFITEPNGTIVRLIPVLAGADIGENLMFCDYNYIDDNNIRISFNNDSYVPVVNSTIEVVVYTTLGADGNFIFSDTLQQTLEDTEDYSYFSSKIFLDVQGKSEGGIDGKNIDDLKRELPRQFQSRGNIINTTDINNYFQVLDHKSDSRLYFILKTHNQFNRMYYGYLLQRDINNNIVPTNTINVAIPVSLVLDKNSGNIIKKNNNISAGVVDYTLYTFDIGTYVGLEHQICCSPEGYPYTNNDLRNDNVDMYFTYANTIEEIAGQEAAVLLRLVGPRSFINIPTNGSTITLGPYITPTIVKSQEKFDFVIGHKYLIVVHREADVYTISFSDHTDIEDIIDIGNIKITDVILGSNINIEIIVEAGGRFFLASKDYELTEDLVNQLPIGVEATLTSYNPEENSYVYTLSTGIEESEYDYNYIYRQEILTNPELSLMERPDLVTNAILRYMPEVEDYTADTPPKRELQKMNIAEYYDRYGFLYTFPYKTILNSEGPICSFYQMVMDELYRIRYNAGNSNSPLEMILTYATWKRSYKTENNLKADTYILTFSTTQNLTENMNLLVPVVNKSLFSPIYMLLEQFNNLKVETNTGVTTGNTNRNSISYYYDITEAVIHLNMSDADIKILSDVTNNGKILYNSLDKGKDYSFVIASSIQNAETNSYTDTIEAREKYESYVVTEDSLYAYKKMIYLNGNEYAYEDEIGNDYDSNKVYVETHYNGLVKDTVSTDYTALVDALYCSAQLYATTVPIQRYTITEYDTDDSKRKYGNILYDSEMDKNNTGLVFLQLKNRERIINIRTTLNNLEKKKKLIPTDTFENDEGEIAPTYEYQVINRLGIVKECHYTDDWEPAETPDDVIVNNVQDELSDLEYDTEGLYTEQSTDKRIPQAFKLFLIDENGLVEETAKYVDNLQVASRWIAKQTQPCLLYYRNKFDIDEENFTRLREDLIYKFVPDDPNNEFYRLLINSNLELSSYGEARYLTRVIYFNENSDMKIEDRYYQCSRINVYKIEDSVENLVETRGFMDIDYRDSGEVDRTKRSYFIGYTLDGNTVYTESKSRLKEVLDLYANGTFKYNRLYRSEKGDVNTILYHGTRDLEMYFVEYMNEQWESNAFVVSTRAKLALVYKKVYNTINNLVTNSIWITANNVDSYIKIYDAYGNDIDINESYSGQTLSGTDETIELYPIFNAVVVKSADKADKYFTNILKALEYGVSLAKPFSIYTLDDKPTVINNFNPSINRELWIYTAKYGCQNIFNIYLSEQDYISSGDQNRQTTGKPEQVTQSFKVSISNGVMSYVVLYLKDESELRSNTKINIDEIQDEANLGLNPEDTEIQFTNVYTDTTVNTATTNTLSKEVKSITTKAGKVSNNISDIASVALNFPDTAIDTVETPEEEVNTSTLTDPLDINEIQSSINGSAYMIRIASLVILYDEKDQPICYFKGKVVDYNASEFSYVFKFEMQTEDKMDVNNNICINANKPGDLNACYYPGTYKTATRFLPSNVPARIYLLARFADVDGSNMQFYGDLNISTIVDFKSLGLEGYSVMNIYDIVGGLDLFTDFTDIVHTNVVVSEQREGLALNRVYRFSGLPVIRASYANNMQRLTEFISNLKKRKAYIENAKMILENNYAVDMKFYNTYGPGTVYYTTDPNGKNKRILDRVNITLTYGVKLKVITDDYTIQYIKSDIKSAIEDLDEITEFYLDNLAAKLYNTYQASVYYIEFRGLNWYDATRRNFFIDKTLLDSSVPEFININLIVGEKEMVPDINIVVI